MTPTPIRAIRIPDDLWDRLRKRAKENNTDASTIIRQLIQQLLDT